jgi:hypothetical protein
MNNSESDADTASSGKDPTLAVWPSCVSAVSALVYFLSSEGIRTYLRLMNKVLSKVIFITMNYFR